MISSLTWFKKNNALTFLRAPCDPVFAGQEMGVKLGVQTRSRHSLKTKNVA